MGSISIDVKKKEREYELFTFSDYNVVKYIILYRSKLDVAYGASTNINMYQAGDIFEFNEEIVCLYASLDKILCEIEIKDKDREFLKLIFMGYTVSDVIKLHKEYPKKTAYRILDRVIERILEVNLKVWNKSIDINYKHGYYN